MGSFYSGLIAGFLVGLATIIGALPVLRKKRSGLDPWRFLNLDFALGMMLAASVFNLIIPALQSAEGTSPVVLTTLFGIFTIKLLSGLMNLFRPKQSVEISRAWMFITAMMLHNFPEGLAAGASLSLESSAGSYSVLIALMFQNFPEGLATAAAFLALGLNNKQAFFGAFLTGVMEIIGGIVGGGFSMTAAFLPFILAIAGGAMISVTTDEILVKVRHLRFGYFLNRYFITGFIAVVAMNFLLS